MNIGRWALAESPVTIEYSLGVLEQIRALAEDGLHRLSRGGVEVGGILFGRRDGFNIRILAMRQAGCSYSRGPAYLLSDGDQVQFDRTVASYRTEIALEDMSPLGWFVTRTRGELQLTEADREIFATYFPNPWQVTLILKPGRMGSARAAFIVRNAKGEFDPGPVVADFPVEPLRQTELAIAAVPATPIRRTMTDAMVMRTEPRLQVRLDPELPRFLLAPPPAIPANKWKWIVLATLLLLTCVLGARFYVISRTIDPLSLQASDREGEMRIEWNRKASILKDAKRGVLEITDNRKTQDVPLTAEQLSGGTFSFIRKGADVDVRLVVYDSNGGTTEEVARYLGQPIPDPSKAEIRAAHAERDQLKEKTAQLEQDLHDQSALTQKLEKRTKDLENLLRIERTRSELMRRP